MTRLINADELSTHKFIIAGTSEPYAKGWNDAIDAIIDNAPTIPLPDYKEGYKQAIRDGKTNYSRPKGKWIVIGIAYDYAYCTCSECGKTTRLYRDSKNEFCCIEDIRNTAIACLYCGAEMKEADNE